MKPDRFRLALCQANPTVGALRQNLDAAVFHWKRATEAGADMIAFPEMYISGYPPQDLILKSAYASDCMQCIEALARSCSDGATIGIGGPLLRSGSLFNAYYILSGGEIRVAIRKHHLPNHAEFDEVRHFAPGPLSGPYRIGEIKVGSPICEDAWHEDVCETLAESGADILVVPNGSPYFRGKMDDRQAMMVRRVIETGLPMAYVNLVGGQDDLVFDGSSFVLNPGGKLALLMPAFEEGMGYVDFEMTKEGWRARQGELARYPDNWEQDYRAMVVSLRDYLAKSGFSKVLVGLSGGVDSALVAAISADSVGPDNLRCVFLPSNFTSSVSREDAYATAANLGCRIDSIPISSLQEAVGATLNHLFRGTKADVTEENVQSRLRGLLLMALSNKFGEILVTTGNKSEAAVGYATIYGDMAGGYNPIKDLYKTRVFETCRWRNRTHRSWMLGPSGLVIPERVITKPPSAELRADQKDSDSLPEYNVLDEILELLIDRDKSVVEVEEKGFDRETVRRVEQLIYASEYKRFQAAPGTRLTGRALWRDRRYPIVNGWRDRASDRSQCDHGAVGSERSGSGSAS